MAGEAKTSNVSVGRICGVWQQVEVVQLSPALQVSWVSQQKQQSASS